MTDFFSSMMTLFSPALEFTILFPGLLLSYLPVKQYLKLPPAKLAALAVPFVLSLCLAGGALSSLFSIKALWLLFPAAVIAGVFYHHSLRITRWKSVSVFLAVCGIFSCLGNVANAIDYAIGKSPDALCLSSSAALAWFSMCCAFLFFAWYPATHAARELLADDSFAQTWYVFWILPVLFIALNLFIRPFHPELLAEGRLFPMYIVICLFLMCLLSLFYALFYLMAMSLNRNDRLRQENQFLSMQQARYDSLQTAIAETREARHDLKHHFDALLSLAGRKDWEALTKYLTEVRGQIPVTQLYLCDNTAADSVAGHYALQFKKAGIPCSFALDLPSRLPVPEIDLCLVLSNLLENALEASLKTLPAKRSIRAQAYLRSGHMILLTVENSFDGEIKEKDGILQSSKRRGAGVGTQSVRHIAEKNGGYCRFHYENGRFCANVMLRAKT